MNKNIKIFCDFDGTVTIGDVGDMFFTKFSGGKVEKDIKLNVYALGEADRDGEYDFGRIVNFDTREKVWELDTLK